jgi:phage FluMu protein gp41
MRLARALDEVEPLEDNRTRANEAYMSILLLSRVIVRLGDISPVSPAVIEELFASDFAYLQELYIRLNEDTGSLVETECPSCGERFTLHGGAGTTVGAVAE